MQTKEAFPPDRLRREPEGEEPRLGKACIRIGQRRGLDLRLALEGTDLEAERRETPDEGADLRRPDGEFFHESRSATAARSRHRDRRTRVVVLPIAPLEASLGQEAYRCANCSI